MNKIITDCLSTIKLKKLQQVENIGIFPLVFPAKEPIEYLTLNDALRGSYLRVTEIDEGGSVPELKVTNNAEIPVLLLDGEELAGAKQNRIVNTTILLKEKSETLIPVSCTEQGRWDYTSREFSDSGVVMPRGSRAKKTASVSQSLRSSMRYESNQGEVWDEIRMMSDRENVRSRTHAMKDVYDNRMKDLDRYMEAFTHVTEQNGLLVVINGKVAGLDLISFAPAYEQLNPKLVKSYVMDAILQKGEGNGKHSHDNALAFLDIAKQCNEKKYKSVGHGWDYRYEGSKIVGSSLLHKDQVIHMSFFRADESDKTGPMAGFSRRRGFRI